MVLLGWQILEIISATLICFICPLPLSVLLTYAREHVNMIS